MTHLHTDGFMLSACSISPLKHSQLRLRESMGGLSMGLGFWRPPLSSLSSSSILRLVLNSFSLYCLPPSFSSARRMQNGISPYPPLIALSSLHPANNLQSQRTGLRFEGDSRGPDSPFCSLVSRAGRSFLFLYVFLFCLSSFLLLFAFLCLVHDP